MSIRSPNLARVPRVLLDSSVLRCGHVATSRKLTTTITQDGRSKVVAESRGFIKRPANRNPWKQRQSERVPTIAHLVLEGKIDGFSSRELSLEYCGVWEERRIGNAFADVRLRAARVPIYRSRFGSTSGFDRDGLVRHCKMLLRLTSKQAERFISEFEQLMELDEFETESFRDIATFHDICRADNNESHLRDAFHLWTAERNGIDYFCMIERRFANYIKSQRQTGRVKVKCAIVTPEELLDRLGVTKLVPPPLKDGWFYHYGGGEEEIDPPSRNWSSWRSFLRSYWSASPK